MMAAMTAKTAGGMGKGVKNTEGYDDNCRQTTDAETVKAGRYRRGQ